MMSSAPNMPNAEGVSPAHVHRIASRIRRLKERHGYNWAVLSAAQDTLNDLLEQALEGAVVLPPGVLVSQIEDDLRMIEDAMEAYGDECLHDDTPALEPPWWTNR